MKIQFGAGHNPLPGWVNRDKECNIARPLPFAEHSASHVFAEHVIEHVALSGGIAFLRECLRILKPGGVLRVAFPDVTRIDDADPAVAFMSEQLERASIPGKRGARDCWLAIMTRWGHQSCWTQGSMRRALLAVGFESVEQCLYADSAHAPLRGIEGHHKVTSLESAILQTTILEATAPNQAQAQALLLSQAARATG